MPETYSTFVIDIFQFDTKIHFLCAFSPHDMVSTFIDVMEDLATQRKARM